jgi:Peptidase family M48
MRKTLIIQNRHQKRYFWICFLAITIAWNFPASANSDVSFAKKSKETIINGVLEKDLLIMPQLNKLNFGFGRYNGIEYFYQKTISKIFFQDKKLEARVIGVVIESSDIALELSHPILGTGTIKFSFSKELIEQTSADDVQKILLQTLGDENHQYVVLDPQNKLYHLWSCNHLPDPHAAARMKREEAEAQGYRADRFCFNKVVYLPQFSVEKALEREWEMRLRNYEPMHNNSEKQAQLTAAGQKVLQNWPYQLLGYDYTFYLANSPEIDAFAIPTGKIIITTALFDSLASDDELEALIVYAMAHIEQRHSLKEHYACLEDEEYAAAMKKLADVASALAGPAGGVVSGALNATLPEASCNPQTLGGYQFNYIQEADATAAFYFDLYGKDKSAIESLIKKLLFNDLSRKLHPDQPLTDVDAVLYNDRLKRLQNTRFVYFKRNNHFILKREGKPPAQLDLIYQRFYDKENKLFIHIDEKNLLASGQKIDGAMTPKLEVTDINGKQQFQLNDQFLTEDIWGAYLTFEAFTAKKQKPLLDIETVVLSLVPSTRPHSRETNDPRDKSIKQFSDGLIGQTGHQFTFVPETTDR